MHRHIHQKLFTLLLLLFCTTSQAAATTPLLDSVQQQNIGQSLELIASGATVDDTSSDDTTALMWAVHHELPEIVAALLDAGADPNHINAYGSSAMLEVMLSGNNEILSLLLDGGADPLWANAEGETALMLAARSGNLEAARTLLKAGADVNATEHWGGQNALMWATAQGQLEMMQLLIDHGADLDQTGKAQLWDRRITSEPRPKDMNKGGFAPLHYAARQGCLDCLKILVEAGADLNVTDPDRVSALNLALINVHFDAAAYLIEEGADINSWDLFGRTPLYNAVDMNTLPDSARADLPPAGEYSGLDIITMLLDRGANPNAQLKLRPPYRNAVMDRRSDHILGNGATPLMRAAKASDNDVVNLLLEHGALVDLPNWMGITPLMVAAGLGRTEEPTRGRWQTEEQAIETLQILLDAGADINHLAKQYKGRWAHMEDEREFFKDIPEDGQTALHGAAKLGRNQVVEFLVENGARMQVPDVNGRTALDFAWGRYPPAFLLAPAQPLEETIALLERLCNESDNCQLPSNNEEILP